jgi:transcriptional regulator with XRE-family HTH domain
MVIPSSPTVWRRWLALELRRLREEGGIAQKDAGRACGWSGARLSYLENAQQNLVQEDLDKLLPLYEVPEDQRDRYYDAAERSRERGWWERFEHLLVPDWLSMFVGLEQGAAEIRSFQPIALPGLLQTPDYAAAVMRRDVRRRSTREIERLVDLRTARQGILSRSEEPTRLSVVLDESVLSRGPGELQLMAAQLQHLGDMAARPNITLRVLPLDQGVHSLAPGPFSILTFPWKQPDPGIAYVEYRGGALYLEEFEDVESHTLAFEGLADLALSPEESLAMVREASERYIRQ